MTDADPFSHRLLDARAETPMQRKLRRLRPWPVGCVFIERPGQSDDDIREHFRLMKRLGFTALKQCQPCRGTDRRRLMHMAMDEGIVPFWFDDAGWEDPTPELLLELGIDPATPIEQLRRDARWTARQMRLMRERIDRQPASSPHLAEDDTPPLPGVPMTFDALVTPLQTGPFLQWLKANYPTIDALNTAWNLHHSMIAGPRGDTGEFRDSAVWRSWDDLAADLPKVVNNEVREYRRIRDVLRFKADLFLDKIRGQANAARDADPHAPFRAGGEMGLFLPFASRGVDMEGIARLMCEMGSFYPSIHLSWHFEETDFEYLRPVYMQASIAADWMKGGWSASWEATGGPQQLTGYKAPFVEQVRDQTPGFTVDAGVITQLMLSWIAAGFRGFGLWSWSSRTAGWEAGEYGLLDRNNRVTPRAVAAGQIGRACQRLRDELWQTRKEPVVGVLQCWDNEAIWGALARGQRDHFKSEPVMARIGAARALINANVPWEHVTASEIRAGLATRYRCVYLPAILAIGPELLASLADYVRGGGRIVLDAPGGWFDDHGQLLDTNDGSAFEQLFGVRIADCQFSRPGNRPWLIDEWLVEGCTFDLQPTTAQVVRSFSHDAPAATVNHLGAGTATVLGWSASLNCRKAGNSRAEKMLLEQVVSVPGEVPFTCYGAIAYRLAGPAADHYFLVNDGPETEAVLRFETSAYARCEDAISESSVDLNQPVPVPAHSGRWLRCVKQ